MSKAWRANPPDATWRRVRRAVLARDGGVCQIRAAGCTHRATEVDHVLGRGVSERLEDLRAACRSCNAAYKPPHDPAPQPRTKW